MHSSDRILDEALNFVTINVINGGQNFGFGNHEQNMEEKCWVPVFGKKYVTCFLYGFFFEKHKITNKNTAGQ